jgi:hypothetical protein
MSNGVHNRKIAPRASTWRTSDSHLYFTPGDTEAQRSQGLILQLKNVTVTVVSVLTVKPRQGLQETDAYISRYSLHLKIILINEFSENLCLP